MPKGSGLQEIWNQIKLLRGDRPCSRYAPSPTGPLHLGNIRTALIAWLQARLAGGVFILRIEDLDTQRNRPGSAKQILGDLRWLGLDWDEGPDVGGPCGTYTQSERLDFFQTAFDALKAQDKLFPCYCSRKDIAQAVSAPHRENKPGIYPGTCRPISSFEEEISDLKQQRPAAWRYQVSPREITHIDKVTPPFVQDLVMDVGDFVIKRNDGAFAYQLAVVVDDILMGITDVVRGEDLLDSTTRQLVLYEEFRILAPRFWHVPLLLDEHGERMAKRTHSESLLSLQEKGYSAPAVIGLLAAGLGWVDKGRTVSARELLQELDQEKFLKGLIGV